jgi:hypothetical protein
VKMSEYFRRVKCNFPFKKNDKIWGGYGHTLGSIGVPKGVVVGTGGGSATPIKQKGWPKPPPNHHWGWFWPLP